MACISVVGCFHSNHSITPLGNGVEGKAETLVIPALSNEAWMETNNVVSN